MSTSPDKESGVLTDVFVSLSRIGGGFTCPAPAGSECFRRHRVEWCATRPAPDGHGVVWHFRAPDAESVRIALRHAGVDFDDAWAGRRCPPEVV